MSSLPPFFITVFLFQLYNAERNIQPRYQGVFVFKDEYTSLPWLHNCTDIKDASRISDQALINKDISCLDRNDVRVKIDFIQNEERNKLLSAPNALYYVLPYDEKLAMRDEGKFSESIIPLLCWDHVNMKWNETNGWLTEDNTRLCCNGIESPGTCTNLIFFNKSSVKLDNNAIETGYGFDLLYTAQIWPSEPLMTSLTCGKFQCNFKGSTRIPPSELCSLTISSNERFNLTVPYLTSQFEGECVLQVRLDNIEGVSLFSKTLQLILTASTSRVSSYSDTGLQELEKYSGDRTPLCVGDAWPPTTAFWMYKTKKLQQFSKRYLKVTGNTFYCRVNNSISTQKPMRLVTTPSAFSSTQTKLITEGKNTEEHCYTNLNDWNPHPQKLGWTVPNGTSYFVEVTPNADNKVSWTFEVRELGEYQCWGEVTVTLDGVEESLKKTHVIIVDALSPTARGIVNGIVSKGNKSRIGRFPVNYWYLIGLALLAFVLTVSVSLIYKAVKKNQTKVTNLDTKLSLDKVRTKMGVNALYSKVDLSEEDPVVSRVPQIHKEDLVTDRILGSGQFGKVLKGRLTISGGEIDVAVKCLMHPDQEESTEEFLKEVVMMYQLNHQNIIKLLGICTEFDQYMIISEFMENGNLKDFLMNGNPSLSMSDKLFICYQVACGLEYMTSQSIVHRDIAARNCLVGPNLSVKVADFGLSRSLAMSNYYSKVGGQVPIRWMSPEAIKFGRYTKESDVWAFGVLMWEVYTEGHFPYSGYSNEEVQVMIDNGRKLHIPHCNEDVGVLMQAMWEKDPSQRPLFKDIRSRLNQMMRNSELLSTPPSSKPSSSSTHPSSPAAVSFGICAASTACASNNSQFFQPEISESSRFLFGEDSSSTLRTSSPAGNRYACEPGVHETAI